jgi:hypothetical protein
MAETRSSAAALARRVDLDVTGLRWAGGAMLGLGVVLPHLPHNPGLPCPLRTLTGIPCPLCGMTTAVKAGMAGHLGSSVAANPFGLVAIVTAVLLLVRPDVRRLRLPIALLACCALTSWVWELRRFGII